MALTAHQAAVVIERSEPGELGYSSASKCAQFGHVTEQAQGRDLSDSAGFLEAGGLGFEFCVGIAQGEHLSLKLFDFSSEEADNALRLGTQPAIFRLKNAAFFLGSLGHEMIACSQTRSEALEVLRDGLIRLGRICEAKIGKHLGINAVCFGQDIARSGKITDLARIDHADQNASGVQVGDELVLIAASSLADDMDGLVRIGTHPQIESGEAGEIVGDREYAVGDPAVDGAFGHVGPQVEVGRGRCRVGCNFCGHRVLRFWIWFGSAL